MTNTTLTKFILLSSAPQVLEKIDGTDYNTQWATPGVGANAVIINPAASARNVIQPTDPAVIPFTIRGAASQTANLQEWQNSAGTAMGSMSASGALQLRARAKITSATLATVYAALSSTAWPSPPDSSTSSGISMRERAEFLPQQRPKPLGAEESLPPSKRPCVSGGADQMEQDAY